jgi:hypothetical protein
LAIAPICVLIGDDILPSSNFAAVHLKFHQENREENIAGLGLTRWNESDQTVTPFMRWMDESGCQFEYPDLLRGIVPEWRHFYTSNLSLKTELLRQNPFNEEFRGMRWMMEDGELGYRLQRNQQLRLVFLPEALADHIHPTDFRKACRRAYMAGLSAQLFDRLWPDRPKPDHSMFHRSTVEVLCRNGWLLPPVTWLTEKLTRIWCPNPLLRPILSFHAALGQRARD